MSSKHERCHSRSLTRSKKTRSSRRTHCTFANQSGAVAPHSKSCEAMAMESCVARGFGVRCDSTALVRARTTGTPAPSSIPPVARARTKARTSAPLASRRCFVREPKRRCRAALQDLRDTPDGFSDAPDLRGASGNVSDARCYEAFGVRCDSTALVRARTTGTPVPSSIPPVARARTKARTSAPLASRRCFVREPKRRCRAALQKLRGEGGGVVRVPERRCRAALQKLRGEGS